METLSIDIYINLKSQNNSICFIRHLVHWEDLEGLGGEGGGGGDRDGEHM